MDRQNGSNCSTIRSDDLKLGVSIMAHPKRNDFIADLAKKLPANTPIIWDTDGAVWLTGKRAWEKGINSNTTHWLVLQDDAILCRDLIDGVENALKYIHPQSPLSLYMGKTRPSKNRVLQLARAATPNTSFIRMNRLNWGVGVAIPTTQIHDALAYCEKRGPVTQTTRYDLLLSRYFEFYRIPVWYTWPSLIDHRKTQSVLNHEFADRQAHQFIGSESSALDIDWSGDVINFPLGPKLNP